MSTPTDLYVLGETTKIASRVAAVLSKSGKTRVKLAEETGLSVNTIHNLLNGRNATLSTMICVAFALNVSLDTFFTEPDESEECKS